MSTAAAVCRQALEQARARLARRGPVAVPRLRETVGRAATRDVFDECLLALEREGVVILTPHARPEALDALERLGCVASPRGPIYFVTWRE